MAPMVARIENRKASRTLAPAFRESVENRRFSMGLCNRDDLAEGHVVACSQLARDTSGIGPAKALGSGWSVKWLPPAGSFIHSSHKTAALRGYFACRRTGLKLWFGRSIAIGDSDGGSRYSEMV
jgi:hypothetical protein